MRSEILRCLQFLYMHPFYFTEVECPLCIFGTWGAFIRLFIVFLCVCLKMTHVALLQSVEFLLSGDFLLLRHFSNKCTYLYNENSAEQYQAFCKKGEKNTMQETFQDN